MAEHCKTHDIVLHLQDGCEPACEKGMDYLIISMFVCVCVCVCACVHA